MNGYFLTSAEIAEFGVAPHCLILPFYLASTRCVLSLEPVEGCLLLSNPKIS